MEDMKGLGFNEESASSCVSDVELHFLGKQVEIIRDKLSSLEEGRPNLEYEGCTTSITLLKKLISSFFVRMDNLGNYSEYRFRRERLDINGMLKDMMKGIERDKKSYKHAFDLVNKARSGIASALSSGKISIDEYECNQKEIESSRRLLEIVKQRINVEEEDVKIGEDIFRFYLSLEGGGSREGGDKILKSDERFVKKYEYDFGQLKKYGQRIISLSTEVEGLVRGIDSKESVGEVKNEYKLSAEIASTINVEKSIPNELRNLFEDLSVNGIDNDRLRSILWKIYSKSGTIPSKYINSWISIYNLIITPEELKSILEKVFVIREEKEEGLVLDGEINDKEVVVESESDKVIDSENQDLKNLNDIYNKLKNKKVESREFYLCFFGILKDYLSLKIDDEEALVKQFRSFEKHNYFYSDIVSISEDIIKNGMKPTIIRKATTTRTGKVIKFPIGLHSKVRIIIADDDRIVGLYSHADYVRYFGWG